MRRTFAHVLLAGVIALGGIGCAGTYQDGEYESTEAHASAGVEFYYGQLSDYGRWVHVAPYGTVWCPVGMDVGWRPYTVGHWVYTDWGWMWVSSDPWGWVPYHYGRWALTSSYGWIWVPDDVWAPAWVAWRYGDGWAGWAPLPPDVGWSASVGISYASYDFSRLRASSWCFAPVTRLTRSRLRHSVVPAGRNVTLINITKNVTRYESVDSRPIERGLRPTLFPADVKRGLTQYRVRETESVRGRRGVEIRGTAVEVSRPRDATAREWKRELERVSRERVDRPPERLRARQEAQGRRLEDQMRKERGSLQRQHAEEMRKPPRGASREEIRRRHDAEIKAQREHEQQVRSAYEKRREMVKRQMEERQGRDRGRGKGRERPGRGG
jgi:hypothetical protein